MHYQHRVNRVFTGKPDGAWRDADLRTVFDPPSEAWGRTSLAEKAGILKALLEAGESIQRLVLDYKRHHREQARGDTADATDIALAEMLEYLLAGGRAEWSSRG